MRVHIRHIPRPADLANDPRSDDVDEAIGEADTYEAARDAALALLDEHRLLLNYRVER